MSKDLDLETRALAEACLIIKNDSRFKPILDWMEKDLERCRDALETQVDDKMVRFIQGEARTHRNFFKLLDDMSTLVNR